MLKNLSSLFFMTEKQSRAEQDYGLPKLTLAEAAKVLRVPIRDLKLWLIETIEPSPGQWNLWTGGKRAKNPPGRMPEAIIRLYLTDQLGELASRVAEPPVPVEPPPRGEPEAERPRRRRAAS